MALEFVGENCTCYICGKTYPRSKGFLSKCYGELYKGIGHLPYCMECVDKIYSKYLSKCNDPKVATRLTCRKLDLYWNGDVFDSVFKQSSVRSVMTRYIVRINGVHFAGKSYDDTLIEEERFLCFQKEIQNSGNTKDTEEFDSLKQNINECDNEDIKETHVEESVINFWGTGYSAEMYEQLEQRRKYYANKYPDTFSEDNMDDIGSEILMKQICNLEVTINRDAAAGKAIDKSVNSLNTLIGSLNLKPTQKKDNDIDASLSETPLGVWLYKYENKRPLPEVDDKLKDVNHVKKYVFTWMGHLCKMLGIKNGYTRLYEEEINRLRVEKPEYDDEDDESLIINSYSENSEEPEGTNE